MKTRIAIFGYGNLGKGVELAVKTQTDMELVAIFTRRDPKTLGISSDVAVYHEKDLMNMQKEIDVLILCGGSANDLPTQTPQYAQYFNVVDSFDNHHNIPIHFERVNKQAQASSHTALISAGWDPGLFSLMRVLFESILTKGESYTFWGKGVSQGHSDAIRRIDGVVDAKQYTIPIQETIAEVRAGLQPKQTLKKMHRRECYVVADAHYDKASIEKQIVEMPDYFADYETTVHFISEKEMLENHSGIPHGGMVIRDGRTDKNKEQMEFHLKLDSNPEFTASVLVAYARAIHKLSQEKKYGAYTVFDIALRYLSPKSNEQLRQSYL